METSKAKMPPSPPLPSPRGRRPSPNPTVPPWEVIQLLSHCLEPKTLAVASCVSKSWYAILSSEHVWKPICHSLFPSSIHLTNANPAVSPRHLFLLLHAATTRRRLVPSVFLLSLRDLVFTVDIFHGDAPVLSLAKTADELLSSLHEVFRFDVGIGGEDCGHGTVDFREELRVVWMVVTKECGEAFTLMDYVGKGRLVGSNELWFSEKLPCPSSCCCCCSVAASSDLEAEVFMELCDEGGDGGRIRVERVSLRLMNNKAWRYVTVYDGLLYLQSLLLPCRQ